MTLTVGSLFSGIGGIDLGLERTGGFRTIWFCENDKYASAVLRKHWPDVPNLNDITKVDWNGIDRPDILCGGFPCQDISVAGKGKGIVEGQTRSGLWHEFQKAIRVLRPRYALIENVSALPKRGLHIVLAGIAEAGYDAVWFTLSAAQVGAPHKRERLFIVAYSDDRCEQKNTLQAGRKVDDECNTVSNPVRIGYGRGGDEESSRTENDAEIQGRSSPCVPSDASSERCDDRGDNRQGRQVLQAEERSIAEDKSQGVRRKPRFGEGTETEFAYYWRERIQRLGQGQIPRFEEFSWCENVGRVEELKGRTDIPEPLVRGASDGIPIGTHDDREKGDKVDRDTLILEALKEDKLDVNFGTGEVFSKQQHGKKGQPIKLDGAICNGYLVHRICYNGIKKQVRSHRVVWMAKNGKIPDGFVIDHINRNKLDNRLVNLRLADAELNANNCEKPVGGRTHKLSIEEVIEIRELLDNGNSYRDIAKDYGISKSQIGNIANGKSWNNYTRNNRIKTLGNAVVPQVAQIVGEMILEFDKEK